MKLIPLLTRIDGRVSRKPYWIATLLILSVAILAIVAILATFGDEALDGPYSGSSLLALALGWVVLLATVPVTVKRLHDLNRSGIYLWPIFIFEALLSAGDLAGVTGNASDSNALGWSLIAIYGIYALALFIQLGFFRGTDGRNAFGPDPLGSEEIPATVNL